MICTIMQILLLWSSSARGEHDQSSCSVAGRILKTFHGNPGIQLASSNAPITEISCSQIAAQMGEAGRKPDEVQTVLQQRETFATVMSKGNVLPDLFVYSDPTFIAIRVSANAAQDGPFLAFGERFERVGKSTHRVDMDYRLLAQAFQRHLWDSDSNEPLPFRFCERCGSKSLSRSSMMDQARDEQYFLIECDDCGWSEWTQ